MNNLYSNKARVFSIISVISFLVILNKSFSQTKTFEQYLGGNGVDYGYFIQQVEDSGYIVTGNTESTSTNGEDIFLLKLNAEGDQEWYKTFRGGMNQWGKSVQQTKDGGYIVTGWTGTYENYHLWLIKTDAEGNEEWNKIKSPGIIGDGLEVKQTPDEGFIVAGEIMNNGNFDGWVLKIDKLGNTEWEKKLGGSEKEIFFTVELTPDNGYIFLGFTFTFSINSFRDYWLVKTDSVGNVEWSKSYDGIGGDDWGRRLRLTPDGGYIFTGASKDPGGFAQMLLIKTDEQGTEEWRKQFGGTKRAQGRGLDLTDDGGYIISGKYDYYNNGNTNGWLIKTDELGNEVWNKHFGSSTSRADLENVEQTTDRGYICTGFSYSSADQSDLFILKVNEYGIVGVGDKVKETQITEHFELKQNYPNPFNPSTAIEFHMQAAAKVEITICDITGRQIKVLSKKEYSAGRHRLYWNGKDQNGNQVASGVYFCRMTSLQKSDVIKLNLLR